MSDYSPRIHTNRADPAQASCVKWQLNGFQTYGEANKVADIPSQKSFFAISQVVLLSHKTPPSDLMVFGLIFTCIGCPPREQFPIKYICDSILFFIRRWFVVDEIFIFNPGHQSFVLSDFKNDTSVNQARLKIKQLNSPSIYFFIYLQVE